MGKSASVIICEPQCWGFEHVPFNTALLQTVCMAYPSDQLIFYGETTHLESIQREMRRHHYGDRILFRETGIPNRESSGWRRLPSEIALCNMILAEASCESVRVLIFSSVTNTSLLATKILMSAKGSMQPVVAVVHGCLSNIVGKQARRPWNWIIGLRRVLALPHRPSLRLVALGDSLLNNVVQVLPKCESQWNALDHVYLWPSSDLENGQPPHPVGQPVRFGYVGVSSKGFNAFCRLADDVAPQHEVAQFTMAGFYNGPVEKKPVCQYITDIPDSPLSRKEFEDRVGKLTYVVWTAKPDHYRLTASGTFLDALAFLKPGIYLRNDYIEHYFNRMGDIGYLCNSYEDMVSTIHDILSEFPFARYQQQVENIRKGRVIFEPETLAPQLRDIVESCDV